MLRALSFAHLLGPVATHARAEEDDQDDAPKSRKAKGRRAEDDDQDDDAPKSRKAKGRRAEDDDQDDDAPKSRKAKGRRAEEDDDEDDAPKSRKAKGRRAEEDDDEDDAPKSRKAKGRRAEEDDDEDDDTDPKGRRTAAEDDDEDEEERQDDEDDRDPKARAARKRERARCAAIFGSKHASGRVAAAANLAFNTKMTASQAIGVLKTLPQEEASASASAGGLGARMDAYGSHRPGAFAPPQPSRRQAKADSWDAAAQRAGIGRK
jgi:hypothetical protein